MKSVNLKIFTTCSQSAEVPRDDYANEIGRVARWSDELGYEGMLIYSDHRLVDPWIVASMVMSQTERLSPLVAVQPIYMHPYAAANMVSTLGLLHGRKVYLNMIAGGFVNDLRSLDDETPHDRRYDRLIEYTQIIQELLENSAEENPLTREGEFYTVRNLRLAPTLPKALQPNVFVSGSSEAGLAAAIKLGATAVQYPTPPSEFAPTPLDSNIDWGVRVGIVARDHSSSAWEAAERRFPEDRAGRISRKMATRVSDSEWHKNLEQVGGGDERSPYWLIPFEQYQTMCPYLVGSYDEVAQLLAQYVRRGYKTFILDIPLEEEDLQHAWQAFERASRIAESTQSLQPAGGNGAG